MKFSPVKLSTTSPSTLKCTLMFSSESDHSKIETTEEEKLESKKKNRN